MHPNHCLTTAEYVLCITSTASKTKLERSDLDLYSCHDFKLRIWSWACDQIQVKCEIILWQSCVEVCYFFLASIRKQPSELREGKKETRKKNIFKICVPISDSVDRIFTRNSCVILCTSMEISLKVEILKTISSLLITNTYFWKFSWR